MPKTIKQREMFQRKHNALPNDAEVVRMRRQLAEMRKARASVRLAK